MASGRANQGSTLDQPPMQTRFASIGSRLESGRSSSGSNKETSNRVSSNRTSKVGSISTSFFSASFGGHDWNQHTNEDDMVKAMRFSLSGEFFHVMISHRQRTEGSIDGGNGVAFQLYRELQRLSLSAKPIPPVGYGQYPTFAKRPDDFVEAQCKVFMDEACLQEGKLWKDGFIMGLCRSIVFVCLLSWRLDEETAQVVGSVGGMMHLTRESPVDNVLLEIIMAIEMCWCGMYATRVILPVFIGQKTTVIDRKKKGRAAVRTLKFQLDNCDKLPDIIATETNTEAARVLGELGVPGSQIEEMMSRTVRQNVQIVLQFQGIHIEDGGNQLSRSLTPVASRCLEAVVREIEKEQSRRFQWTRPQAREVLEWLRDRSLGAYAPIFAQHGLDSLYSISRISTEQLWALCEAKPLNSQAKQSYPESDARSIGNLVRLTVAVDELRSDPRAQPLKHRLDYFRDESVSTLTALVTGNGLEVALSKSLTHVLLTVVALCAAGGFITAVGTIIDNDGLPGLGSNFRSDEESELPYTPQYSVVFNMAALLGCSCLGLLAAFQARHVAPFFAKKTVHHLIVQGFFFTLLATISDVWQTIEYHNEHGIVRGSFFSFSAAFMVTVGIVLAVFHLWDRALIPTFLLLVASWCAIITILLLTLSGFREESTALSLRAAAILLGVFCLVTVLFILLLLILYLRGRNAIKKVVSVNIEAYNSVWRSVLEQHPSGGHRLDSAILEAEDPPPPSSAQDNPSRKDLQTLDEVCGGIAQTLKSEQDANQSMGNMVERMLGLEQRAQRKVWSGKYTQRMTDMDVLFGQAAQINQSFQELVATLCAELPAANAELLPGAIKQAERALQKTVRTYHRDCSCVTDIVRCKVIVDEISDVTELLKVFVRHSVVGFRLDRSSLCYVDRDEPASMQGPVELQNLGSRDSWLFASGGGQSMKGKPDQDPSMHPLRITGIKNRLSPSYDVRQTSGYRDIWLNVEVGWVAEGGSVQLIPVELWDKAHAQTHVCEVQIHIRRLHEESTKPERRRRYIQWRNLTTR